MRLTNFSLLKLNKNNNIANYKTVNQKNGLLFFLLKMGMRSKEKSSINIKRYLAKRFRSEQTSFQADCLSLGCSEPVFVQSVERDDELIFAEYHDKANQLLKKASRRPRF